MFGDQGHRSGIGDDSMLGQHVEDVGRVLAELQHGAREEVVRLPALHDLRPGPAREGFFRVVERRRRIIAVDDDDLAPVAGYRQGRGEPRDPGTDDDDPTCSHEIPSAGVRGSSHGRKTLVCPFWHGLRKEDFHRFPSRKRARMPTLDRWQRSWCGIASWRGCSPSCPLS